MLPEVWLHVVTTVFNPSLWFCHYLTWRTQSISQCFWSILDSWDSSPTKKILPEKWVSLYHRWAERGLTVPGRGEPWAFRLFLFKYIFPKDADFQERYIAFPKAAIYWICLPFITQEIESLYFPSPGLRCFISNLRSHFHVCSISISRCFYFDNVLTDT